MFWRNKPLYLVVLTCLPLMLTSCEREFFKPSGTYVIYEQSIGEDGLKSRINDSAEIKAVLVISKGGYFYFQRVKKNGWFYNFPDYVEGRYELSAHEKYPFAGYITFSLNQNEKRRLYYQKPNMGVNILLWDEETRQTHQMHSSTFLSAKEYRSFWNTEMYR